MRLRLATPVKFADMGYAGQYPTNIRDGEMGREPTLLSMEASGSFGSTPALPQRRRERPLPLRVFGCLPVTGRRGCTEAGVRKASREETAGEFAPTLVSVYGEFAGAA
jgi:hypothetical protein